MEYEIHIGQVTNLDTLQPAPKLKFTITSEQFNVIEQFADIELDSELNKTYILNKCRFTVHLHFNTVVE